MVLLNQPLVSVVVPCLNRAHYLVPTVESILQQDYPNIECIVVDGGSSDGTIEILKGYSNRIKWISEPDKGHADAINKGWQMSKGEILAWLNADDCYVVPDAIMKAVDYFKSNPEVDLIYGDYARLDENGEIASDIIKPRKWDLVYAVKYCYYTIPQPTSFMRRSILKEVNWLDREFCNGKDHELWIRIGLVGQIQYIPVHLAYARACVGLSQDGMSISEAKVKLTEKFFTIEHLPTPLASKEFQRRALSNAYLVGSLYAWDGGRCISRTMAYALRSIHTDVWNLPYITTRFAVHFSRVILSWLFSFKYQLKLKRILTFLKI
jgi:glycosyltransferase involved in cell wall biosynthesis